jgi:hypothetical protein
MSQSASNGAEPAAAAGARSGVLNLCCCTRCHSPARKLVRLVGVRSQAMAPLPAPSKRVGVLGASCTTAPAADNPPAVAAADVSTAWVSLWERDPTPLASVAAAAVPGWRSLPLLLHRLAAASEIVSTANRRCHSLSPMMSREMAGGLPGSASAAAALRSAAVAVAAADSSGETGLANCSTYDMQHTAQHSTAQHSTAAVSKYSCASTKQASHPSQ